MNLAEIGEINFNKRVKGAKDTAAGNNKIEVIKIKKVKAENIIIEDIFTALTAKRGNKDIGSSSISDRP